MAIPLRHPAHAEEPTLERTEAYILDKVRLWNVDILGRADEPGLAFNGCHLTVQDGDRRDGTEYPVVDLQATEPVEVSNGTGTGDVVLKIFRSEYNPFKYTQITEGKREQLTAFSVDVRIRQFGTLEPARRLARALNHLRELCGASSDADPFGPG